MSAVQLALEYVPRYPAAERWRSQNPLAYAQIIAWAQQDAAAGRTCSMQRYMEFLRDPQMVPDRYLRMSAVYKVDHRLRRPITDLILSEYPTLPFMRRKSMYDAQGTYASPRVSA